MITPRVIMPILASEKTLGAGGTERRFFRLFKYLETSNTSFQVIPVVTEGLLTAMRSIGLGLDHITPVLLRDADVPHLRSANPVRFMPVARRILANDIQPAVDRSPVLLHCVFAHAFQLYWVQQSGWPMLYTLKDWRVALGRSSLRQKLYLKHFMRKASLVESPYPYAAETFPSLKHKLVVNYMVPIDYLPFLSDPLSKKKIILFLGRLISDKGIALLLDALALAKHDLIVHGWHVDIVGHGPLKETIAAFIANHGSLDISLCQTLDPTDCLRAAAIYLKLNQGENIPSQSLLEAMAAGCAVIATDVGNTRAWLTEQNAMIVRNDAPAVAAAIRRLVTDEVDRRRLGSAAEEWVRTNSSYERYSEYYETQWWRTLRRG